MIAGVGGAVPDAAGTVSPEETLRHVNENLVLAALRAYEAAEAARGAMLVAETEAQSLRASELELRATCELRERLLGIIGHDLRNPLNTIVMAASLMVGEGTLAEKDARMAKMIASSAHRMSRMIGQLIAFTRARMGGVFVMSPGPVDLREVCESIAEEARLSSPREIVLAADGDLWGMWDFDLLAEAISNIVGNAVDHAAVGTAIEVCCHGDRTHVLAEITNAGPTIPPQLMPRIFDAFRRAEGGAESRAGHLGLGLYIASEIVRGHRGQLTVRSANGSTTFTIRLPRVGAPREES